MKKTKQKWCLRILVWLVAVLVLLGVADSCRVQEDPHRTLVQGSLQELNDSWTLETDQQRCGSLLLCRRARPERRWCFAVRSRRPSARC